MYRHLDWRISRSLSNSSNITSVYLYEDGACRSFRLASELGLERVYDLPIPYWEVLHRWMTAEAERWPEWSMTIPAMMDSRQKLLRKSEEVTLANKIVVASTFTLRSLDGKTRPDQSIRIIPYGCPPPVSLDQCQRSQSGILKLLYVGSLTQRKGLAYLQAALNQVGWRHLEVTIIGRRPEAVCPPLEKLLARCTHIPTLPHAEILSQMRRHDLLVFPSIAEGFGLVISEALSQGLPVLTTENTAGPDLIGRDVGGWVVPPGSTEALVEKIELALMRPSLLREKGEQAVHVARSHGWEQYRRNLCSFVLGVGA
ncbi:MAG TPA: glycosyltransferase family 4 protein [Candidatus Ozemobacteraceae bacterium]|nr:glycosyltransferase family 4 protein [Candidatus Ozemobacteraceae bacterium]